MPLELQILIAFGLDLLIGDPRKLPHPVKIIGRLAVMFEQPLRRTIENKKLAGIAEVCLVIACTGVGVCLILWAADQWNPILADLLSIYFLYCGIAARDMIRHSKQVYAALNAGSLEEARRRVGMICGRDTDRLDEAGITKATVESVAENMVDGVTAPLFFGVLGGPVGMMVYKAVNTLDSTFGYKNERYLEFGWASAKLDDAVNFIPARLTGLLVPLAAVMLQQKGLSSLWILIRDRKNHPSPNSGHTEAAVAGALGIELGGLSYYSGQPSNKPTLGDPIFPVKPAQILAANRLLLVTSGLALIVFMMARLVVIGHMT